MVFKDKRGLDSLLLHVNGLKQANKECGEDFSNFCKNPHKKVLS